jgi:hypothetical protein
VWRSVSAVRLEELFVAAAVGLGALPLMPAVGVARRANAHQPRIYIDACGAAFAPRSFLFECSTSAGPPPQTRAFDLTYRHYGTGLALAVGEVDVCLGPDSRVQEFCLEGARYRAEAGESYRTYRATFRFFDVVSCTSRMYSGPRLFYGKFSYTFAGRPWETRTHLPPENFFFEDERLKCHPVRLPVR